MLHLPNQAFSLKVSTRKMYKETPPSHEDIKGIVGGTGLICLAAGAGRKSSPTGRTGGLQGTTTDLNQASVWHWGPASHVPRGAELRTQCRQPKSGDPCKSRKMGNRLEGTWDNSGL